MTSVQSHLLQLSGNKYLNLVLICIALSCSSKQLPDAVQGKNSHHKTQPAEIIENKAEVNVEAQKPVDSNDIIYPVVKKPNYCIAFILPLMLDATGLNPSQQKMMAQTALEFYMGATIALQIHTERSTIHFDAYFFDCDYKYGAITNEIIPELKKIKPDLIIGPLSIDHTKELSVFCKENKVNLVSPLLNSDSCLSINPYFVSMRPSERSHLTYMSNLLNSKFKSYNISIITESSHEKERYAKMINSVIDSNQFGRIQSYYVNETNWRNPLYRKNMIPGRNIFIVYNKSSEVVSNSILTNLIGIQNKDETAIIAPHSWIFQGTIDLGFLQSLNSHFITDYYFDYNDSINFNFISRYRSKYNTEPPMIGCLGYTYTDFLISALVNKGVYFQREWLNNPIVADTTASIQIARFPDQQGFQNYHLTILKFEGPVLRQLNLK